MCTVYIGDLGVININDDAGITVKPLILVALNFGGWNEIILVPLILACLLAELLVMQYINYHSNIRNPLVSQICRGCIIHKIKGTQKFRVLQYKWEWTLRIYKTQFGHLIH